MSRIQGRITKADRDLYIVFDDNKFYNCKARGKFRKDNVKPLVGDFVIFDKLNETEGYIIDIEDRKNKLDRPPVSNVDICFIVTSVVEPTFSPYLVDKMISISEINNIEPVICFTKFDLASNEEKKHIKKYLKYYKKIGYKVFENHEIRKIKKIFKNKVTVFAGQTGVGKSTLLNKLEVKLDLNTDQISKALGRGKHTTRHVQLFPLFGGWVGDTPGFSSIDFYDMTKKQIRDSFIEFRVNCKYRECMHLEEPDCEVKKLIFDNEIIKSRYESYKKFMEESK